MVEIMVPVMAWNAVGTGILGLVVGIILGFIITRSLFTRQLKKNPPINEKMVRALYMSMGRKPSEADIRRTMNAVKNAQ